MSKRRLTCVLAVLGLMTFVCTALAAPAGTGEGKHCVVQLVPADPGPTQLKASQQPECFRTFRDAIFSATKGRILLPKRSFEEQLDILDQEIRVRGDELAKAGSFVTAIDYQNSNFGGATLTWTSPGPCTSALNGGFNAASMPSGWNDVVSSTRGFSNCDKNVLWEHANFMGTKLVCRPDCSSVGSMNDKTSSREWHHLCEGTSGQWAGCRGDGCSVCAEKVANYPCYFQNHPNCNSNSACGGLYFTCSDTCPAPTQADTCFCSATASCANSGGGSVSCSGSAGTCFSVNDCYVECDGVQTFCPNPRGICPF